MPLTPAEGLKFNFKDSESRDLTRLITSPPVRKNLQIEAKVKGGKADITI